MNGLIIVNKERGKTSFSKISEIRKKYGIKKVGHIGTLDPEAEGVLPILIGNATKLSDMLMQHDKTYIAKIVLGKRTDTGDIEGNIIEEKEVPNLEEKDIKKVLNSFLGKIKQIPPMYSAIKINGEKLYNLARKGQKVDIPEREIEITKIELLKFENNIIEYSVDCSKGTYIRVVSEDIAKELGTVGYTSYLKRTRVGQFNIIDENKFIKFEDILDLKKIEVNELEFNKIKNGVIINKKTEDGLVKIYLKNEFKGICEIKNNRLKRKILEGEFNG